MTNVQRWHSLRDDSNPVKLPAQANIKISYRTHPTMRATRAIAIIDGIAVATVALFGSSAGLVTPIKSRARLAKVLARMTKATYPEALGIQILSYSSFHSIFHYPYINPNIL